MGLETSRIQCLNRTMDIFEELTKADELGVSELSKRLGLHVATIHNIVKTLTLRNYLINVKGRYRIGPALASLAVQWDPVVALSKIAKPHLEEVTKITGELTCMTVMVGMKAELISIIQGTADVTVQFTSKTFNYPMVLSTGRLLVAFEPEKLWDKFIKHHMAGGIIIGKEKLWKKEDWYRELKKIQKKGSFILRRTGKESTSSVAVSIRDKDGSVVASIGSSFPNFKSTSAYMNKILNVVSKASTELSKGLGYRN